MTAEVANILFVEDCDSDFEMACAAVGQSPSVNIRRVTSGGEFLSILAEVKKTVDLFVLDLCLPDTSGLELAKQVRSCVECVGKPVVIFSSSTNPGHRMEAKECGANDYRVKPIAPDEYLGVVRDIVHSWLPKKNNTVL